MAEIKQVSANVQRQGSKSLRTGIRELATSIQSFSPLFATRRRHYRYKWSLSDRFSRFTQSPCLEDEHLQQPADLEINSYENRECDKTENKENEPSPEHSNCVAPDIENDKCSQPLEEEKEECPVRSVPSSSSIKGVDDMVICNEQDSGVPITCMEDNNTQDFTTNTFTQVEDFNIDSMRQPYSSPDVVGTFSSVDSPPLPPPPPRPKPIVPPTSPPPPPPPPPAPQYRPPQVQVFSQPPILNNICYGNSFIPVVNSNGYQMTGMVPTHTNYWQYMSQDAWNMIPAQGNEVNYHQNNNNLVPVNLSVQSSDCRKQTENRLDIESQGQTKHSPAISNSSNSPSLSNPKLIEEHPYAPPIIMRNILKGKNEKKKQNSPGTPDLMEKSPETTEEEENVTQKEGSDEICEATGGSMGTKTSKRTGAYELFHFDSDASSGKSYSDILKKRVRHTSGSSVSSINSTDSQSSKSSSISENKNTATSEKVNFHGRTLLKGDVRARNIPLTPLYIKKPFTSRGKPTEVPKDPRVVKPSSLDQRCSAILGESEEKEPISLAVPNVSCSEPKPKKCESPHKMLEDILHKAISQDGGVKKPSLKSKLENKGDFDSGKLLVQNRVALLSPNLRTLNQMDKEGESDSASNSDLKEPLELKRNVEVTSKESENVTMQRSPIITESENVVNGDSCNVSEAVPHEEKEQNYQETQELEERIQNTMKNIQMRSKTIAGLVTPKNKMGQTGGLDHDSSDFKDSDSDILVIDVTGYSDFEEVVARDQLPVSEHERTVEMRDSEETGVRFDDGDKQLDSDTSVEKMRESYMKKYAHLTSPEIEKKILDGLDVVGKNYETTNVMLEKLVNSQEKPEDSLEEGEMRDSEDGNMEPQRKHRHRHRHHRSRHHHRRRRSPRQGHSSSVHDMGHGSTEHHRSSSRHRHRHRSRSRSSLRHKRSRSPGSHRNFIDLTTGVQDSESSDEASRSRSTSGTRSRSRSDSRSRTRDYLITGQQQQGPSEQTNKRNVWDRLGLIMDNWPQGSNK